MLTVEAELDCRVEVEPSVSPGLPGPPSRPAWAEVEAEGNSQVVAGLHLGLAFLARYQCADCADCVDASLSPC